MVEDQFEYGPVARGIFYGLVSLTILVGLLGTGPLLFYILFLQFLAMGLKPFLIKTGLYQIYMKVADRRWRKITAQRCMEVENEKRKAKYKYRRRNDDSLPRNW